MDMKTRYLGLELPHPFMPGSSPLLDDLDMVKRLEDAGASALVMRSLFEEQVVMDEMSMHNSMDAHSFSSPEAASYFPTAGNFTMGPHEYLEQIRKVKAAVAVPVIASLNGAHMGHWLSYAKKIQEAGADALEMNVYFVATDPKITGADVEQRLIDTVKEVKSSLSIPVAVKVSKYYSSMANLALKLDTEANADGLVLFNRFFQPDIDVEELEVRRSLKLSSSGNLLLRLRWLAILFGKISAPMAVSGGVHCAEDAIKAIMAGASAVQMVSTLLDKGPEQLARIRKETEEWMEAHEYESLEQMKGSMSLERSPDPFAFERANYMHILQSWRR